MIPNVNIKDNLVEFKSLELLDVLMYCDELYMKTDFDKAYYIKGHEICCFCESTCVRKVCSQIDIQISL